MTKPKDVDEYIASFPPDVQQKLEAFRATVREAAPGAEETISYGMPLYKLKWRLVYFAAHTKHIGFYPMKTGITAFQNELSGYKGAAGSVQFPFSEPLPLALISRIVKFRVAENLQKADLKKK